ncbi:Mif2/CENP-C like-domain-containing protein [Biscogniauxia mediterranea]|nr:Mif2/CENP-C like-domain-containing protein [Biscogniauxia mediterranea]
MVPRPPAQQRRTSQQAERLFELGKAGRKTGITLPDTGRRDEHGFEEMDGLFSSPEKELSNPMNGHGAASEEEQDEEEEGEDMEIDDGDAIGPATVRKLQREGRPSLPRSRSPIKTNLQSPARQNPHLGPTSSPTRGTIVGARERSPKQTIARKLDFSVAQQRSKKSTTNGHSKVNGAKSQNAKLTNGRAHDKSDEEVIPHGQSTEPESNEEEPEESMQMLDMADEDEQQDDVAEELPQNDEDEEEEEEEEEQRPIAREAKSANKSKTGQRRGRKPKATAPIEEEEAEAGAEENSARPSIEDDNEEPSKKQRGRAKGRPPKAEPAREPTPPAKEFKASKRGRPARNSNNNPEEEENNDEARGTKRQRTADKASKPAPSKPIATKEKGKPGRKRKSSGIGVDSPVVQRGPPLPKGRGLVTLRREEPDNMRTTRSGRASYRPLEFWKGERAEYDEGREEIFEDKGGRHFAMPTLKGVVRAETNYEAAPKRRRGRPSARPSGKASRSVVYEKEPEEERDDWEYEPGVVSGQCIEWSPEYEHQPPGDDDEVVVEEKELAISEPALQFKNIKDSTFKFAKTLTLPFFGAGIVDLPPGAEKRPKNARKMQMVFFVHTGSVHVTVADNAFKIAKGGMWFVPRGNHYSITNESNRPARIFFAQGCEVLLDLQDEEGETQL